MIYTWYYIFNKDEFDALNLVSKTYTLILKGIGQREVLVTKGNYLGITYDDVFLPVNLDGKNELGTNEMQYLALQSTPDSGAFTLVWEGIETSSLAHDSTAAEIQAELRLIPGLELIEVTQTSLGPPVFRFDFLGVPADVAELSEGANTLTDPPSYPGILVFNWSTYQDGVPRGSVPFQFEGYAVYIDLSKNVWLGIEVEDE
jgi:hypothetical protein